MVVEFGVRSRRDMSPEKFLGQKDPYGRIRKRGFN